MLKACWDCIAGNIREQSSNETAYGTQLNGAARRAPPPWPESQANEIMFVIPRKLNSWDKINITGTLRSNPQLFSVYLISGDTTPDYQNIVCQFEARLPNGTSNENSLVIKVVEDGEEEIISGEYQETEATDVLTGNKFTIGFVLRGDSDYEAPVLDINVDGSNVQQFRLKHNLSDIRFLTLKGDIEKVEKLDFEFS